MGVFACDSMVLFLCEKHGWQTMLLTTSHIPYKRKF